VALGWQAKFALAAVALTGFVSSTNRTSAPVESAAPREPSSEQLEFKVTLAPEPAQSLAPSVCLGYGPQESAALGVTVSIAEQLTLLQTASDELERLPSAAAALNALLQLRAALSALAEELPEPNTLCLPSSEVRNHFEQWRSEALLEQDAAGRWQRGHQLNQLTEVVEAFFQLSLMRDLGAAPCSFDSDELTLWNVTELERARPLFAELNEASRQRLRALPAIAKGNASQIVAKGFYAAACGGLLQRLCLQVTAAREPLSDAARRDVSQLKRASSSFAEASPILLDLNEELARLECGRDNIRLETNAERLLAEASRLFDEETTQLAEVLNSVSWQTGATGSAEARARLAHFLKLQRLETAALGIAMAQPALRYLTVADAEAGPEAQVWQQTLAELQGVPKGSSAKPSALVALEKFYSQLFLRGSTSTASAVPGPNPGLFQRRLNALIAAKNPPDVNPAPQATGPAAELLPGLSAPQDSLAPKDAHPNDGQPSPAPGRADIAQSINAPLTAP
jgi:hypothetical protein